MVEPTKLYDLSQLTAVLRMPSQFDRYTHSDIRKPILAGIERSNTSFSPHMSEIAVRLAAMDTPTFPLYPELLF
jgi:hypothetical protein